MRFIVFALFVLCSSTTAHAQLSWWRSVTADPRIPNAPATDGRLLASSGGTWVERGAPSEVPAGGGDGQVLTANGAGDFTWADAAGGAALTALSTTIGPVVATESADVDIALPDGVSQALLVSTAITRTAGTASAFTLEAFALDDRSDAGFYLYGDAFNNATADPGPAFGPTIPLSGGASAPAAVPYFNADDSAFLRLRLTNQGADLSTWSLSVVVLPIPEA